VGVQTYEILMVRCSLLASRLACYFYSRMRRCWSV